MGKWLNTLIEEKGLNTEHIFEVEHRGETHFIEFNHLIEVINKSSAAEKKQIKNILVMIDFKNGDIMHFLTHLATGYIKTNY